MNMIKYIPLILRIFKRARVLAGATQSSTTKAQWEVAFPVAIAVAALGVFIPDLQSDVVAQGLVIAAVALVSPLVARLLLYRENIPLSPEVLSTAIVAARKDGADSWHELHGTVLDAQTEGYDLAVLESGSIIEIDTGAVIGAISRRTNTDEESRAIVKAWVQKIKGEGKSENQQ